MSAQWVMLSYKAIHIVVFDVYECAMKRVYLSDGSSYRYDAKVYNTEMYGKILNIQTHAIRN